MFLWDLMYIGPLVSLGAGHLKKRDWILRDATKMVEPGQPSNLTVAAANYAPLLLFALLCKDVPLRLNHTLKSLSSLSRLITSADAGQKFIIPKPV